MNNINENFSNVFKEYDISDVIIIPSIKPSAKSIIEIVAYPTVNNIKVVETENIISNEGKELSGKNLIVDMNIVGRMVYISDDDKDYIYVHNFENVKSVSLAVPKNIESSDTYGLYKSGRLQVNPSIENIHARKIDDRSIYTSILLYLDVKTI